MNPTRAMARKQKRLAKAGALIHAARQAGRAGDRAAREALRQTVTAGLPLDRRAEIAQAAVDTFADRALVLGEADCVRLLALVVGMAGWPDPAKGLTYKTPAAAGRTLKRLGYASLAEAVDDRLGFERIPLARHLQGDLVWIPSDCGMGALGVATGGGKALAFVDASVSPYQLARMKRRLAGFDHRVAAAKVAGKALAWSAEELGERLASIEAKRSALAAILAGAELPPVRAHVGAAAVAQLCWRLAPGPSFVERAPPVIAEPSEG